MNAGFNLTVWLQLFGMLAVETALVVGAAALISRFVASAAWRRTIWQVCFLSLLALTLSELTGTARGVVNWLDVKVKQEKRVMDGPTTANWNNLQPNAGQLTKEFRGKVVDLFAQEKQLKSVGTAEASSLVVQPPGADTQPVSEPTERRSNQNPTNGAEAGVGFVADWLAILGLELIWLLGAGLVIARGCLAHALFSLFRRHRQAVGDAEVLSRVQALARRFGIKRRIYMIESSRLVGPIVFGVFRPVIGLPADFASRFSPVQQEAMLAHELAHVAAHDPVWYLLANWASAILWWHPMVWWARGRLRAATETAADEASLVIVDGPVVLAECLAEIGARLTQQRSSIWMGVEGNGLRSGLGRRVERLIHLRGNSYVSPNRLRSALAKTLGPAAMVATAILSTAWVGPQAFTKGESMKTMKQTWKSSLAAFALLASPQEETRAALAANAKHEGRSSDVARLLEDGRLLYEVGKLDEAESKLQQVVSRSPSNEKAFYYQTLIQERRYAQNAKDPNAIKTPSARQAEKPAASDPATEPPTAEPTSSQQNLYYRLMRERYGIMPPTDESPPNFDPRTKKDRSPIVSKLERIVLDEVMLEGVPLPEVLRFLDEESRKRDAEKHGINFLINPNSPPAAAGQTIDPTTGVPITLPSPEPLDMNSVIIRFNLPLRNMRLKDVLDAIVKVADRPIEYSVEEYGVVFSQSLNPSTGSPSKVASSSPDQGPLEVRTFMVDTNTFLAGLKRAFGAGPDTNNIATTEQIRSTLRGVFTQLGINMDVPGKTVFYNDLTGIVMVRATPEDLEIVRAAIETLGGSGTGQLAQPGMARDGATFRYKEEMMRRYGIDPTHLGAAKK